MTNDNPPSVLLLEDEVLIEFDFADHLRDAGFRIVGVLPTCAEALAWLSADTPDIVVLDINLRDGICAEVVRLLKRRKIPFIVHSGTSHDATVHDPAFLDGIRVPKPCSPEVLVASVAAAVSKGTAPRFKKDHLGQEFFGLSLDPDLSEGATRPS